jgi:hypothetical protein
MTIGNEKHHEEMKKSRMEAERKPREAENFRKNADSHGYQKM